MSTGADRQPTRASCGSREDSSTPASRFDRDYYRRYYGDPRTRVADRRSHARLGDFVCTYLRFLRLPVRRVLDAGCGLGWWRAVIERHFPRARYEPIEVSEHLCARYGWRRASVVDFSTRWPYDLVICQGVLPYLSDADADTAIESLGRLCRGALYLEAITREDWRRSCDRARTDGSVRLRAAHWYRHRLARRFTNLGGGLFLRRTAAVALYDLERAP